MKRLATLALVLLLTGLTLGCGGSDKDRAKNSNLDRPRPAGDK